MLGENKINMTEKQELAIFKIITSNCVPIIHNGETVLALGNIHKLANEIENYYQTIRKINRIPPKED